VRVGVYVTCGLSRFWRWDGSTLNGPDIYRIRPRSDLDEATKIFHSLRTRPTGLLSGLVYRRINQCKDECDTARDRQKSTLTTSQPRDAISHRPPISSQPRQRNPGLLAHPSFYALPSNNLVITHCNFLKSYMFQSRDWRGLPRFSMNQNRTFQFYLLNNNPST
jgi:hypothetical protein